MISDENLRLYHKPIEDEDMELLRRLEKAAIAHIQIKTGRYLGVTTASFVDLLQNRGWPLKLSNEPTGGVITSLESWDGSAWSTVAGSSYYIHGSFLVWNSTSVPWTRLTMPGRFRATYPAGFAQLDDPDETDAPEDIKQAVHLLVGHWYENRESVVVGTTSAEVEQGVEALLNGHTNVGVG